jgi:hypothetical protein
MFPSSALLSIFPRFCVIHLVFVLSRIATKGSKENILRLHQNDRTNLFQNGKKHWMVKICLAALLGVSLISVGSSFKVPAAHAYSNVVDRGYSITVIRGVFGPDADQAIRVAECESGLNPAAYNPSGAAGLFQIMPGTWVGTSQRGASRYDAHANAVAAHDIFVRDGHSWREWACPA